MAIDQCAQHAVCNAWLVSLLVLVLAIGDPLKAGDFHSCLISRDHLRPALESVEILF